MSVYWIDIAYEPHTHTHTPVRAASVHRTNFEHVNCSTKAHMRAPVCLPINTYGMPGHCLESCERFVSLRRVNLTSARCSVRVLLQRKLLLLLPLLPFHLVHHSPISQYFAHTHSHHTSTVWLAFPFSQKFFINLDFYNAKSLHPWVFFFFFSPILFAVFMPSNEFANVDLSRK